MDNHAATGELKKKIEKKPNRYVAVTKRQKGLFKIVSELSILCGSQISIRSEGDRVFSAAEIGEEVEEGFTEYVDKDVLLSTEDQESVAAGERVEEKFMVYGEEVDQDVLWSELERKNVHQPAGEIRVKEVFTFYVDEVDQDVLWSELKNMNMQQQKNLSFP